MNHRLSGYSSSGGFQRLSVDPQLSEVVLPNVTDRIGAGIGLVIDEDVFAGRQHDTGVDPAFHHLAGIVAPGDRGLSDHLGAGEGRIDPFGPPPADLDEHFGAQYPLGIPP